MPASATVGTFDVALNRRKALMGDSGPYALIQNAKVFSIALFACIGGLLYGYNQGVFSGILTMNNFMDRMSLIYMRNLSPDANFYRHGKL